MKQNKKNIYIKQIIQEENYITNLKNQIKIYKQILIIKKLN